MEPELDLVLAVAVGELQQPRRCGHGIAAHPGFGADLTAATDRGEAAEIGIGIAAAAVAVPQLEGAVARLGPVLRIGRAAIEAEALRSTQLVKKLHRAADHR